VLDPKKIAELKQEHGDVYSLTVGGSEFVVKAPGDGEWYRFLDLSSEAKKRTRALRLLVESCLLHPSKDEFESLLAKRPAIAMTLGNKLCELAGLEEEATVKKL